MAKTDGRSFQRWKDVFLSNATQLGEKAKRLSRALWPSTSDWILLEAKTKMVKKFL